MIVFSFNLSSKYAIDVSMIHQIRKFKDGVSFFNFDVNLDLYEADHNPQFKMELILFNFKVFEFNVYNKSHVGPNNDTR